MAPNSLPDASTSTAAASTPVATIAQATMFADQSRSLLMTLPRELRNKIYEFVFCDSLTYTHEVISNQWSLTTSDFATDTASFPTLVADMWEFTADTAHVSQLIRLDETKPPSKDSILPCRELYSEMKGMHAVAYRSYWTSNRFLYVDAEMSNTTALPEEKNMEHIHTFHFAVSSGYHICITFEDSKWTTQLLSADGLDLSFHSPERLINAQNVVQDAVAECLALEAYTLDPRAGRGLTLDVVAALSYLETVRPMVFWLETARRVFERNRLA